MRGFSLLETIVGLAIIMIGITFFGVILFAIPLTKTARNQNVAYHVAADKIEELRNTDFDSLPDSGSFNDPGLFELASSTATLTIQDYQDESDIKDVMVEITWIESGNFRNVQLQTLIAENGIGR